MLKKILGNKDYKVILENYGYLFFLQAANYLLPLLTIPYLVRVIGVDRFGLVMFAQSFCMFLNVLIDFGFNLSATRRISIFRNDKEETSRIFSAVYASKVILTLLSFFLFATLVFTFERFRQEQLVYLLSFGAVFGQALFPEWFFQGIEKMRVVTIINVVAKTIFTILIFVFINQTKDYAYVPLFNAIGFITAGIISLFISLRYTRFTYPKKILMIEMARESYSLLISNFAARLFNTANVFLLGLIAGDFYAGIYAAMEKIINALKSFFAPLYQAIYPWLSKQKENFQIRSIYQIAPKVFLVSTLLCVGVMLFGKTILDIVFNDPEITAYSLLFKSMALTIVFSALNMLIISLFMPAAGYYKKRMTLMVTAGLLNLILCTVLTWSIGIKGTVISFIITECFLMVICWFHFKKLTPKQAV